MVGLRFDWNGYRACRTSTSNFLFSPAAVLSVRSLLVVCGCVISIRSDCVGSMIANESDFALSRVSLTDYVRSPFFVRFWLVMNRFVCVVLSCQQLSAANDLITFPFSASPIVAVAFTWLCFVNFIYFWRWSTFKAWTLVSIWCSQLQFSHESIAVWFVCFCLCCAIECWCWYWCWHCRWHCEVEPSLDCGSQSKAIAHKGFHCRGLCAHNWLIRWCWYFDFERLFADGKRNRLLNVRRCASAVCGHGLCNQHSWRGKQQRCWRGVTLLLCSACRAFVADCAVCVARLRRNAFGGSVACLRFDVFNWLCRLAIVWSCLELRLMLVLDSLFVLCGLSCFSLRRVQFSLAYHRSFVFGPAIESISRDLQHQNRNREILWSALECFVLPIHWIRFVHISVGVQFDKRQRRGHTAWHGYYAFKYRRWSENSHHIQQQSRMRRWLSFNARQQHNQLTFCIVYSRFSCARWWEHCQRWRLGSVNCNDNSQHLLKVSFKVHSRSNVFWFHCFGQYVENQFDCVISRRAIQHRQRGL